MFLFFWSPWREFTYDSIAILFLIFAHFFVCMRCFLYAWILFFYGVRVRLYIYAWLLGSVKKLPALIVLFLFLVFCFTLKFVGLAIWMLSFHQKPYYAVASWILLQPLLLLLPLLLTRNESKSGSVLFFEINSHVYALCSIYSLVDLSAMLFQRTANAFVCAMCLPCLALLTSLLACQSTSNSNSNSRSNQCDGNRHQYEKVTQCYAHIDTHIFNAYGNATNILHIGKCDFQKQIALKNHQFSSNSRC